eukprot:CAMPEP_0117499664 /NCGR_PEP_ID=MMETSP0784-20121206/22363_1 /TAXON_ID=39447 /ORGANISM="" /LENGTH=748 /DNA_ID=CAMNT_0005294821 /DNA_START=92 /DNA_END=2333 /DNA_ORIENTATION=+
MAFAQRFARAVALALLTIWGSIGFASAAQLVASGSAAGSAHDTPVARVVKLIEELASRVETDGRLEQSSYDKYACWCEATLARKAADISASKETISTLQTLLVKLKGEIATHGQSISDLEKMVAANIQSQKESTYVREKEREDFNEEKVENEQCTGALDSAIKVLTGAGTGRKGFLETMQEAQLLSVVAGVRSVMKRPTVARAVSNGDIQVLEHFVERPEEFVDGRASAALSAVQIANNPFGDYAPQSTRIQGILKGMYDAFVADMEKASAEEAEAQKAFQQLMATKRAELKTLQATLDQHTLDKATKTKQEAEAKRDLDEERAQLEADEKLFADTKKGCQEKASFWADRSRLRTEELQGMRKAIEILSSPLAQRTFLNATTTFLQLSDGVGAGMNKVATRLHALATKFQSVRLARIAAEFQAGGHFDKVIEAIDQMMTVLRKEEQDDIAHRDRCQGSTNKNANDMEDLEHDISKANGTLDRMADEETDLLKRIDALLAEIKATKKDMADILALRNKAYAEFAQALKDDMDAVALLDNAIVVLTKFYKTNRIPLALVRQPSYTVDIDKAPKTSWTGGDYGGRMSESSGIIAILSMIKEDLVKEIKVARAEDTAAQRDYETERSSLKAALDAHVATKTAKEGELAELQAKILATKEFRAQRGADLSGQEKLSAALYQDCSWVDTHFRSRRDKRKKEMEGLTDAKNYLAGVESGDAVVGGGDEPPGGRDAASGTPRVGGHHDLRAPVCRA